ncbi:kinase-like domain-containing protein [Podospora conica]|nr:kinase-like domain-containing protein [Schizothecium conicum]
MEQQPPKFSLALAEQLAHAAKVEISHLAISTPGHPDSLQIAQWDHSKSRITNIWDREALLGRGTTGHVYLERSISGDRVGQTRAVKVLDFASSGLIAQQLVDTRRRELLASIFASAPWCERHFVKTEAWFLLGDVPNLVMKQYLGDLGSVQLIPYGPMSPHDARVVIKQVLEALAFLHSQQLVHRDVKPENVMVEANVPSWVVKLGDFGVTEYYADVTSRDKLNVVGTMGFMAPEVLGLIPHSHQETFSQAMKADVFATGVLLFILLTRKAPFPPGGTYMDDWVHGRMPNNFPFDHLPIGCPENTRQAVQHMLARDASHRPTAAELLAVY